MRVNPARSVSEIYERYSPRIYSYLCNHLHGATHEAEDLTANVFVKAYEKLDGYEYRGAPFSAWLFRIAHNQLIDHVRSRSRTTQVPLDDAFEVRQPSSFKGLDRRLAVDQIKLAMSTLTEEQRQVIGMRFVEGLGAAEVARRMGRTEEAVKKLQARGLAALKRGMDCRSGCWSVTMGASS